MTFVYSEDETRGLPVHIGMWAPLGGPNPATGVLYRAPRSIR